jgi:hypothetical protein
MSGNEKGGLKRKPEEMFKLLASHCGSELPVKRFCEQQGLSVAQYYYWQKKYKASPNDPNQQAGGFTILELGEELVGPMPARLFAEYKGIRFYQELSAGFLKQLIS